MKNCTGSRYEKEFFTMSQIKDWHGKFGHLNVLHLDHESAITNYGKHDRVVATCSQGNELYCRVDHVWGLGMPTDKEVLAVARKTQGLRGKWILKDKTTWSNKSENDCTDFNFIRKV